MQITCVRCGAKAYRSPAHAARVESGLLFCTNSCKWKYMTGDAHHAYAGAIDKDCGVCGKRFVVTHCRSSARFCSLNCRLSWIRTDHPCNGEKVERPCGNCGKLVILRPAQLKAKRYCSRTCANRAHSRAMKGIGNPNYIHGMGGGEYSEEFKRLSKLVRKRERHCCFLCGKTKRENGKNLDVHHIDWDKTNDCMENLVAICMSCHRDMQGKKRRREQKANELCFLLNERYGYPTRCITFG